MNIIHISYVIIITNLNLVVDILYVKVLLKKYFVNFA